MSEYDNVSIFINLDSAQKFYKYTDSVNVIEIHSFDPQKSDITKLKIADLLEHKLMVTDWKTRSKEFFESLKTERVVMFIILTLIILVAAFNIISSLIMLVKDKTTDVGILRTIGASRASIIKIFFICGSSLGISGTFIGVCLGVSFAANIEKIKSFLESITNVTLFNPLVYYLSHLPSHIEPSDIYKIAFLSLTLSLSATIYPAWRASSINPIDALRS
jgi:lipoprotein-releasing system permease protein